MGFSSFDCLGCGRALIGQEAVDERKLEVGEWQRFVVVLCPHGTKLTGEYDGYSSVVPEGKPPVFMHYAAKLGCWHLACHHAAGEPGYTKPSPLARDQGWFFNRKAYEQPGPVSQVPAPVIRRCSDCQEVRPIVYECPSLCYQCWNASQ